MNNLFNTADASGILIRLENLSPIAQSQWGKMNVSQMLAHCNASLDTAIGRHNPERLGFIGRLFGRMLKQKFFSDQPFPKNSTTDKSYIIVSTPDFETAKAKLIKDIHLFTNGGASKCSRHPHAFFGELTPLEWAVMQWKHLDHHLRQFGV
jgi:hypothetical protein